MRHKNLWMSLPAAPLVLSVSAGRAAVPAAIAPATGTPAITAATQDAGSGATGST
ncbi:MAG TPA: hypothetical protein VLH39_05285 [Magnetospirillaceae bacterium]|nr:hypothetical protein [Magnetospirillaceae bacterium]